MLGQFLILQAFECRRKSWTKGNLRILSQRSCGYERLSRGHLGNLMERHTEGQETGGNRTGGNSESFPVFWQNLVCHSEDIFGGPPFVLEPGLLEGQNFPVSDNVAKAWVWDSLLGYNRNHSSPTYHRMGVLRVTGWQKGVPFSPVVSPSDWWHRMAKWPKSRVPQWEVTAENPAAKPSGDTGREKQRFPAATRWLTIWWFPEKRRHSWDGSEAKPSNSVK